MTEEEQRAVREKLGEEELAIFGLLIKPDMKLTKKQEKQVKNAAKDPLETLKREKLTLDWRKRLQTRAQVMISIEEILDGEYRIYTKKLNFMRNVN